MLSPFIHKMFICFSVELSDLSNVVSNVGEHVNKLVNEFLSSHGFQARDETQQKLLVGQITEMQSKDNRVYKLLCKFKVHHDSVAEELKLVDYTVYNFFFHWLHVSLVCLHQQTILPSLKSTQKLLSFRSRLLRGKIRSVPNSPTTNVGERGENAMIQSKYYNFCSSSFHANW